MRLIMSALPTRALLFVGFCLTLLPTSAQGQVPHLPGSRYGFNFDYFTGQDLAPSWSESFQTAAQGNLGWMRMTVYYVQTQTSNEWAWVQARIKEAQDRGISVYANIFWCEPGFSCIPSESVVRAYVRVAVERLTCRHPESIAGCKPVRYFGFTNEPTGGGLDASTVINQVLRPGFETAKTVDPTVAIVGPEEHTTSGLRDYLILGQRYFDIISIHVYPFINPGVERFGIELFRGALGAFRSMVNEFGRGKPVWLTEMGEASYVNPEFTAEDEPYQNLLFSQMLPEVSEATRPWIKRVFVYRLRDLFDIVPFHIEVPFGILRHDNSPKLAFNTVTNFIATQDPPRSRYLLDSSYPGVYLTDVSGGSNSTAGSWCHEAPNCSDYVLIANRESFPVTARLTFVRPDGSGRIRDVVVPARRRINVDVHNEISISGDGVVSVAVQCCPATDTRTPIYAEHASYWNSLDGTFWNGGRATEGVLPALSWYFAEGATGGVFEFAEVISVFNPQNSPVSITARWFLDNGTTVTKSFSVDGPGRASIRLNDIESEVNRPHGLRLTATAPIVAERTMLWGSDRREGHSSPGVPETSTTWYFAEGQKGYFSTYLLVVNPDETSSASVQIDYLHDNGQTYSETISVAPRSRISVDADGRAFLPSGGFAYQITSQNGVGIVTERAMYQGVDWTVGTAGVGTRVPRTRWVLPEGATSSFLDSYILLANPNSEPATVTLRFLLATGGEIPFTYVMAPRSRLTINVETLPGLEEAAFSSEIEVQSALGIVAERAMYWAAFPWYSGHVALAIPY